MKESLTTPLWSTRVRARLLEDWLKREPFDWSAVAAIVLGSLALWPLTLRLPFLGHDWIVYFSVIGQYGDVLFDFAAYPPWLQAVLQPFMLGTQMQGLALVNAVLIMTVAVAAAREARQFGRGQRLGAAVLAAATPIIPMLWWQGNIAGLVLLGYVGMPFTVPLLLLQPGLTVWAVIARRQWIVWAVLFGLLSILIWGLWPLSLWATIGGRAAHPMSMGWQVLGWPILLLGLSLLVFSNADPLRLMAVGAFLTPYLMPVHLVMLLPALGRVRGYRTILLWLAAWLTLLPAMFLNDWSKYVAMLFPLAVWWFLRPERLLSEKTQ